MYKFKQDYLEIPQTCFLTGIGAPWTTISKRRLTPVDSVIFDVTSKICGSYSVSDNLCGVDPVITSYLKLNYRDQLHHLAGYALHRHQIGQPVAFELNRMDDIIRGIVPPQGPIEQVDEILNYLYQSYNKGFSADAYCRLYDHAHFVDLMYPIAYARNREEFIWLLKKAIDFGYLETANEEKDVSEDRPPQDIRLSIKGFERIQDIQKGKDSRQAFIAIHFAYVEENSDVEKAIISALNESGYKEFILTKKEHNEKIDDLIIVEIRKSRFVIADITNHRQNVYFEAGFALGERIPVVWTCLEAKWKEKEAHFDTRQYNYMLYKDADDLKKKLKIRIEATFGLLEPIEKTSSANSSVEAK